MDADGVDILAAQRTAYLQVARILQFTALDITDYNMYSNFIFDDSKMVDTSGGFTYELKVWGLQLQSERQRKPDTPLLVHRKGRKQLIDAPILREQQARTLAPVGMPRRQYRFQHSV